MTTSFVSAHRFRSVCKMSWWKQQNKFFNKRLPFNIEFWLWLHKQNACLYAKIITSCRCQLISVFCSQHLDEGNQLQLQWGWISRSRWFESVSGKCKPSLVGQLQLDGWSRDSDCSRDLAKTTTGDYIKCWCNR